MNKRKCIFLPAVLAMVLVLVSSCNKEAACSGTGVVTLHLDCGTPDTRAVLFNSATELQAASGATIGVVGINGTNVRFNDPATYTDGAWKTSTMREFTLQKLNYAVYYPHGNSTVVPFTATSSTSLSFTYNVPDDASNQIDILAGYSDNGGSGYLWLDDAVKVTLHHPLSVIKFKYGSELGGVSGLTVTGLTIKGVRSSETCTYTYATPAAFTWTDSSSTKDVTCTPTTTTPSSSADLGVAFALIPQSFATPPTVEVSLSDSRTVSCSFPAGTVWEYGKIYTYTLDFPVVNVPMEISGADVTVTDLTDGGTTELKYD